MGSFFYGQSQFELQLDDALLRHLQLVIGAKLRRRESLVLTWFDGTRNSIWISPAVPQRFEYSDAAAAPINGRWLEALAQAASSASGLVLSAELLEPPQPEAAGEPARAPGSAARAR